MRSVRHIIERVKREGFYTLFLKTADYAKREGMGGLLRRVLQEFRPPVGSSDPYQRWIQVNEPTPSDLKRQRRDSETLRLRPLISVVTPVFNPDLEVFEEMVRSVLAQTYPYWELCLANASTDERVGEIIKRYAEGYPAKIRVRFLKDNRGIAGNSNEALSLARGDFVAFVDHDDLIAPFALYEVVKAINRMPDVDLLYSDRDIVTPEGERVHPFFKPDWSPDLLLSQNYLCHLAVVRRELLDRVGGFREGFEGSQDYDLFLRITEQTDRIVHIPKVLYHWRVTRGSSSMDSEAKPYAYVSAEKALRDACLRRGWDALVEAGETKGYYRVRFLLKDRPEVCIVVLPELYDTAMTEGCVRSINENTSSEGLIVKVIATDEKMEKGWDGIEVIRAERGSETEIINSIVSSVHARILIFMRNPIRVITGRWLETLVAPLQQRHEIGAVGGRLIRTDGTVLSAGVYINRDGRLVHLHAGLPQDSPGYNGFLKYRRNVSAVTHCIALRRETFLEAGGFERGFNHYREVDLCLRLRQRNYYILYDPEVSFLYEDEETEVLEDEREEFLKRWREVLSDGDPYYSPNLSEDGRFAIRM